MKGKTRVHPTHTGSIRDVCERPVAFVVIKNILPVLSYIKVRKAVVVVVTPDATQAISVARYPGLFRNVCKSPVAVIVVESVARRDTTLVEVTAVDKIDVLPAVAIIISHADAGARLFQNG